MTAQDFLPELKARVENPAVADSVFIKYITSAMREVNPANYPEDDYVEQVLDTASMKLAYDNKFPEVQSINQNGVSTSFSQNDPERYRRRVTERRQAQLLGAGR